MNEPADWFCPSCLTVGSGDKVYHDDAHHDGDHIALLRAQFPEFMNNFVAMCARGQFTVRTESPNGYRKIERVLRVAKPLLTRDRGRLCAMGDDCENEGTGYVNTRQWGWIVSCDDHMPNQQTP